MNYGLASIDIWINIMEFHVENWIESDHLPLKIVLEGLNECDVERVDDNELSELKRYEWSEKSLESMREGMNSEHVKQCLDRISKMLSENQIKKSRNWKNFKEYMEGFGKEV